MFCFYNNIIIINCIIILIQLCETVLLCHHWIHPLHFNNCLVQLSYQIWPQKTTEGSPDCWANHWYNPPYSPRTVLIQSEQKGWQNHSGPLTSSTLTLWTAAVWSDATELWAPERPGTRTVSSPRQSISWTPDNNCGTHTIYTLIQSLQRIVRAAEKIVGVSLPSLQDIYSTRLTRKALSIAGDPTHPTHSFFSLLPSGRRLRSLSRKQIPCMCKHTWQ